MKSKIWYVLKKEIREVFRDRKSLCMMLVVPILIPFVILGMSALFEMELNPDITEYNKIGFAYELNETEKTLAHTMNIDVIEASNEELAQQLSNGEIYLYVSRDQQRYIMNYDSDSTNGNLARSFVESYLNQYKRVLQEQLLTSHEASEILDVIVIEEHDIGTGSFSSNYIVGYTFLFIMMAITISATYPATDATAGEKERGTLETLLTFPIKSRDIIIGKLFSVTLSSIITGLLSLGLAILSFQMANQQFAIYETSPIAISGLVIAISVLVIVIYSFFISGLCIAIASMSKTFKEAQSALTPLTFISFFPGMIAFMVHFQTTSLLSIVPFLNFSLVFNDLSVGNIQVVSILLMVVSSIIYTVIVIFYIVKQYHSEKILFSI